MRLPRTATKYHVSASSKSFSVNGQMWSEMTLKLSEPPVLGYWSLELTFLFTMLWERTSSSSTFLRYHRTLRYGRRDKSYVPECVRHFGTTFLFEYKTKSQQYVKTTNQRHLGHATLGGPEQTRTGPLRRGGEQPHVTGTWWRDHRLRERRP